MLGTTPQYALVSIVYYGAFSRLTSGRFTPSFYAYQQDRAPNTGAMRIIPLFDIAIGSLILFSSAKPRAVTALVSAFLQGGGIVKRVAEGKSVVPDLGLFSLAVVVGLTSWFSVA